MALVSLEGAELRLGGKLLFDDVNLSLTASDRVGLIGPNGAGKTSLLKVLSEQLPLDSGAMHKRNDVRVGYLPQDLVIEGGSPLRQYVLDAVPGRDGLEEGLHAVQAELSQLSSHEESRAMELSGSLAELQERLDSFQAHYAEHVALSILSGLGFSADDFERTLDEFSGGWQMRALLASLLFMQPDLLLMDEPTNHLDMPSVSWFSAFLKRYSRAFILISHDREFLNEQIARVVSFEPEGIRSYRGDYERYLRQRAEEAELLENRQKNLEKERQHTQEFIDRFRYKASKAKAVQSRIKKLEKMDAVNAQGSHATATFRFPPSPRASNEVLKGRSLKKCFGELEVFSDVKVDVARGERIALVGANGAGKTTLLRILAGALEPTEGEVILGTHVQRGYFAQHLTAELDGNSSIYEAVAEVAKGSTPTHVRSLLGALLFQGDEVDKPIHVLSGGERARVALAQILALPNNLLLMDEPTNHLDLQSCEALVDALGSYDGTLVFVSHNRGFVRRLATKIWNVSEGRLETYPGTLDDYMSSATRTLDIDGATSGPAPKQATLAPKETAKDRRRREAQRRKREKKVLGPLQDRVAELENDILVLETAQAERSEKLADPAIFQDALGAELSKAYQVAAAELDALTEAWGETQLKLEEAQKAFDSEEPTE